MQPSWNIQHVGKYLLKWLVPKFVSNNSYHLAKEMLTVA
jgi:hypothetical protein